MDYIFGIDGGGTSSRLRIEALDGTPLFYGEGGSTNPNSNPREAVEATVRALFGRARAEAGLDPAACRAGFVGTAGVDRPGDREPFAELVRRASGVSCRVEAGNDAEPALAGAMGDIEGMLLIAGTGAIAYGRTRSGESARAGGWGHLLGDEGSAFRIAFDALARGLRSMEGRDLPTALLADALAFFDLAAPGDLIGLVYGGFDKSRIARFARQVARRREEGDPLAVDLLATAARELAALVGSVDERVGDRLGRRRVAFRGGLIEGDGRLRAEVAAHIGAARPRVEIVEAQADAATGACIIARSLL